MNALLIVGTTVAGAAAGGLAGAWYGFKVDTSDLPMYAAFTTPAGALAGGLVGCVVGAVLFA
jgi:hypothetical protein